MFQVILQITPERQRSCKPINLFLWHEKQKKNLNDLFQKCGVSVVRQQSRFYQDDVVNSNKKIFKATIWKEHQHHIFYYNLMNCCHLQNSCFFAKSSCKKTTQMQRKSGKSNMQTLIHKNLILSSVCSVQASLQYLYLFTQLHLILFPTIFSAVRFVQKLKKVRLQ